MAGRPTRTRPRTSASCTHATSPIPTATCGPCSGWIRPVLAAGAEDEHAVSFGSRGRAQALVGAVRAVPGRADDRAGHDHRERRPAVDPHGPEVHGNIAGV